MGRLPRGPQTVRDVLREQRRLQRKQGYSSAFARSGLNVTAEGQLSSDDFDGDIPNGNAGTQGWGASGDTLAAGNLLLRPRSIGNDALSSLIGQGFTGTSEVNFTLSPTIALRASATVTVPDGFTGALVSVTCSASALNSTSSGDVLYISTDINNWQGESMGGESLTGADAGKLVSTSASGGEQYSGLAPGDTITCSVRIHTNSGSWAANGFNIANMNATVIWFR